MQSTNEAPGGPSTTRRRIAKAPVAIAVVGLVGILLLLYPTAATWVSHYQESAKLGRYVQTIEKIGPSNRKQVLADAARYNAALGKGVPVDANVDIPHSRQPPSVVGGYGQQLAADDNGLMARLRIRSIGADLPIYHGTSDAVLAEGIGHLEGTALPVGGQGTHAVLTGHRGLASAELFTRLNEVRPGDRFSIDVFGRTLTYRVTTTLVIKPTDTRTLLPTPGKDLVTLVTCTPLGVNSHRILVTGTRILPTPPTDVASATRPPSGPGVPGWIGALLGAVLLMTFYVWKSSRARGPSVVCERADPERPVGTANPRRVRRGPAS